MRRHGRSWCSYTVAIGTASVASMLIILQLPLGGASGTPAAATTTAWETCGRSLLKDGKSFFIRGVNYSPSPIGGSAGVDFLLKPELWQRDLPLLQGMHANAIKVYFYDPSSNGRHDAFLDAAYNGGVDSIYTVFTVWIPPYLMEDWVPITDTSFTNVVDSFRFMARQTANHPGTMGYSIGGETNFHPAVQSEQYWHKFNTIAAVIRSELAAVGAKKILTTTYIDDGGTTNYLGESFNADVDIWGTDVYRGTIAEVVLPAYRAVPGGKPLLFAEYGMSFASNYAAATNAEAQMISEQLTSYSAALESNYLGQDSVGEAIAVGGFVFAFSDEWWKDGNWFNHDFGTAPNPHYVLGINSEEYYGLFAVSKNPDRSQVDILTPRPLVSLLTALWSHQIGGFSVAGCGATPLAEDPPTPSPTPSETIATSSPVTPTSSSPATTSAITSAPTAAPTPSSELSVSSSPLNAPSQSPEAPSGSQEATSGSRYQSDADDRPANSSDTASGGVTLPKSVVPASLETARACFVPRAEQKLGIAAFFDASCNASTTLNTTSGCTKNGCRFCQVFRSRQSALFRPCPTLASMASSRPSTATNGSVDAETSSSDSSVCATDSFLCDSGLRVTRDPHANCSFMSCPDIPPASTLAACDAGVGNLRLGIGMFHDQSCKAGAGGFGCDQSRSGCRYCRDASWSSASSTHAGSFLPCPIAIVSSEATDAADDVSDTSTNATVCLVSIGNTNAGIGMLPNEACLGPAGGVGCAADQPGCRYCQLRLTWQSQHLLVCSPASLASSSAAVQTLYSGTGESTSTTSLAVIGCAVVAAVVLAAAVVTLAYRAHRKRVKERCQRQLSVGRSDSIL